MDVGYSRSAANRSCSEEIYLSFFLGQTPPFAPNLWDIINRFQLLFPYERHVLSALLTNPLLETLLPARLACVMHIATNYLTKWIEVEAYANIKSTNVRNFTYKTLFVNLVSLDPSSPIMSHNSKVS